MVRLHFVLKAHLKAQTGRPKRKGCNITIRNCRPTLYLFSFIFQSKWQRFSWMLYKTMSSEVHWAIVSLFLFMKDGKFFSTRRSQVEWKYSHHCTHKHSILIIIDTSTMMYMYNDVQMITDNWCIWQLWTFCVSQTLKLTTTATFRITHLIIKIWCVYVFEHVFNH